MHMACTQDRHTHAQTQIRDSEVDPLSKSESFGVGTSFIQRRRAQCHAQQLFSTQELIPILDPFGEQEIDIAAPMKADTPMPRPEQTI